MSQKKLLIIPKGMDLIQYLSTENLTFVSSGLIIGKDGQMYRLPSGPPEARNEYEKNHSSEPNDSIFDYRSTQTPDMSVASDYDLETVTSTASYYDLSLPIFLAFSIILINILFILWLMYQFHSKTRRFQGKNCEREKNENLYRNYLDEIQKKLEYSTESKNSFDQSSVSDNEWMYMTSDSEQRFNQDFNNGSTIIEEKSSLTRKKFDYYSRNYRALILLLTLCLHIAILSVAIGGIQLYLTFIYVRNNTAMSGTTLRLACIIINPMTSFTMFSTRFYLVCAFLITSYLIKFSIECKNQKNTDTVDLVTLGPSEKRKFSLHQKLVYLTLAHSIPWMIAAGFALTMIVIPFIETNLSNERSSNFMISYYPVIEKSLNCSLTSRDDRVRQPMTNQPSHVRLVVVLIMLPVIVQISLCLLYLFREVRSKMSRISFFLLIITAFISPGLSAVSNLCCEPFDFLQNKLPLIHLQTDPIMISIIIHNHFLAYRKWMKLSERKRPEVGPEKKFFRYADPIEINQEVFAEYPPASDSGCGEIKNLCLPIQLSLNQGSPRNQRMSTGQNGYFLTTANNQRSLVPIFLSNSTNKGSIRRRDIFPMTSSTIEELTEDNTEECASERNMNDSFATAALLSATAAAIAANNKIKVAPQSPIPNSEESSNSGVSSSNFQTSSYFNQSFINNTNLLHPEDVKVARQNGHTPSMSRKTILKPIPM